MLGSGGGEPCAGQEVPDCGTSTQFQRGCCRASLPGDFSCGHADGGLRNPHCFGYGLKDVAILFTELNGDPILVDGTIPKADADRVGHC